MPHLGYNPFTVLHRIRGLLAHINERLDHMATKEQVDKLSVDVATLIATAVDDINKAIQFAQASSSDPAIDVLDQKVTAATQTLQTAMASLPPPAAPVVDPSTAPDPSAGTPPATPVDSKPAA